jgi:hypothetical protein
LLGWIGGRTLDFSVVNSEVTLPGFIVPEHYAAEAWKIHVVDPFDYSDEPLRSQLLALNVRTAEPRGGGLTMTSVEAGLVVYELVQINWVGGSGRFWDRMHYSSGLRRRDGTGVLGTVLLQLLEDRRLRVEVFMGKRASHITGFTEEAQIYER